MGSLAHTYNLLSIEKKWENGNRKKPTSVEDNSDSKLDEVFKQEVSCQQLVEDSLAPHSWPGSAAYPLSKQHKSD